MCDLLVCCESHPFLCAMWCGCRACSYVTGLSPLPTRIRAARFCKFRKIKAVKQKLEGWNLHVGKKINYILFSLNHLLYHLFNQLKHPVEANITIHIQKLKTHCFCSNKCFSNQQNYHHMKFPVKLQYLNSIMFQHFPLKGYFNVKANKGIYLQLNKSLHTSVI